MAASLQAQPSISLQEAIAMAKNRYPALKASRLHTQSTLAMQRTARDFGNLELSMGGEEIGRGNDAVTTLLAARQNLDIFSVKARWQRLQQETRVAHATTRVLEQQLQLQVSSAYAADQMARLRLELYRKQAELYTRFVEAARLRYDTRAASLLEYQSAQSEHRRVELNVIEAEKDVEKAHIDLSRWLSPDTLYQSDTVIVDEQVATSAAMLGAHPAIVLANEKVKLASDISKEMRANSLPKLYVELGSQMIGSRLGYWSWSVGVSVPVDMGANKARRQSALVEIEKAHTELNDQQWSIDAHNRQLNCDYSKWQRTVEYYRKSALPLANEQRRNALLSYREGQIGYLDFIQALKTTMDVEFSYIDAYQKLLETKFNIEYYRNK
ncbi:TolC family protein [Sodaliphilus pleomorphus]|uniref:TolC family protein n=1 Tax=Sodaliphilus pleomorphus TaxID=2606626 RepID=UPI0024096E6B|nr:TolC family protein [Sodaliphilus pleomorphus]MDD6687512.1 TolC family protein [Sodaliphilus pleomorphus]